MELTIQIRMKETVVNNIQNCLVHMLAAISSSGFMDISADSNRI